MKILLPLLAVTVCLSACVNQNASRRNLYSPSKASGPYTTSLEDGSWKKKGQPVDVEMKEREEKRKIEAMGAKPAAKAE